MRAAAVLAFAGLAAACAPAGLTTSPIPQRRPAPVAPPPPEAAATATDARSAESREIAAFYEKRQRGLLARRYLRQDGGLGEGPVTADALARNFERIALYSEFSRGDGVPIAEQTPIRLKRWPGPVRIQVEFGASVTPEARRLDAARVAAYADRLSQIARHPVELVEAGGNYRLFVVSADEQRALGPALAAAEPGLAPSDIRRIATPDPRRVRCATYVSALADEPDAYISAIAVVPSEHPPLSRLACFHEELAQGLGLGNDSPSVRPSIFNDDEEFALLTEHDAMLLRILYDPRLRIGMSAAEARPIVRTIAAELTAEGRG